MSSTRVPSGARGSYPAPGLALTPGPVRNQALAVIAIPFVLIVVLAVVLATTGPDDGAPATDGLYGSGALPGWGSDPTDDGTTDDGTSGDGTDPDGTSGLTGGDTYPWDDDTYGDDTYDDGTTDDTATDDTATDGATSDETGPEATVTAYFDAINNRDFAAAWELGGKNLNQDYDTFVAGFATTQRDDLTVTGTSGDYVSVTVVAWETDGTQTTYVGTYTVGGGVITAADMREGN
ncbi:Integral membrane protein OS=Streptomyces tendae OX=1932 GN=GUR47_18395 PE=4 SV=1 [Streptomyces tendae]